MRFYSEKLLAPHSTPKLEDHIMLAVHDCLFNTLTAILHIGGHSSIRNRRTDHAVVRRTHLRDMGQNQNIITRTQQSIVPIILLCGVKRWGQQL